VIDNRRAAPPSLVSAASRAGVTRLAAVTTLDRLGVPVWQAVRPESRAVSVHSGKGFTDDVAMCGALGEAIESYTAETWWKPELFCTWEHLPSASRSQGLVDWWQQPVDADVAELDWTIVEPLAGAPLAVPSRAISNDFTRPKPVGLIATSAGQAAGTSQHDARTGGLLELIERDAYRRWQDMDDASLTATILPWAQLPDCQAVRMIGDLSARGFSIAFHALPSAIDAPAVACTLRDRRAGSDAPRVAIGSAARLDPGAAIDAAFLEAVQVRATWISGSRDDLTDPSDADAASAQGVALPLPPGMTTSARLPAPAIDSDPLAWLVARLVDAGFARIAAARLDAPGLGVSVEKLFVPGLLPMRLA
jgi:ribosomal protein S12 methylthiotransferase accessory factor